MLMQEAQAFQFHFLRAWIMLKPFNPLPLQFVLMRKLVVLLLQKPRLAVLAGQGIQTLRSAQHYRCVSSKAGQRGKRGNGSKEGAEHRMKQSILLLL
jgi:hypothetical protein